MRLNSHTITPLGNSKRRKFGQVFRVEDTDTGQLYVLKTAKKGMVSEQALEQLKNEHRFTFLHTELPRVVNFDETGEQISLLLQYQPGIGVAEFWETIPKKKRLEFTRQFVTKTAQLLDVIHSQEIFHCDLKPSNFLIEGTLENFRVHLIDFGMAVHQQTDKSRSLIFPLGFAAPELILNRIDLINPTTDYFALGITIYRLWTGKLPLAHTNPSVFTNLQLAHPVPADSSMPRQLNEWIQHVCFKPQWRTAPNLMSREEVTHTLLKSFDRRYTSSSALIDAINQVKEKRFFW
ncbi:MAG: protein kinase [Crocinitomicaceae bacterium]|nr:protein kinase [Crocinitomicaceae bacterium]NGF75414.1 protein kinase [Fluviicola sp. SGL-29]